ncbi:MAG: alpha/beta hydrolase [Candidatus Binatia bacterium]
MPLDPQAQAVLDRLTMLGIQPAHRLTVPEARRMLESLVALRGKPTFAAAVANRSASGPAGDIPVRIYIPSSREPLPVLVYFHGGGWVIGSLDTHDSIAGALADDAGCVVVSVDYRLAPEHPYPAAAEDAYAAMCWAVAHAGDLGADPRRVAVGGDSAGGNLATVTALMARDRGGPPLRFQLLIYPVTDARFDTASYRDNAAGYWLSTEDMRWYWGHYLGAGLPRAGEPYASPLRERNLAGLPAALVITAEFDPLRDEAEEYARALQEAGVPVRLSRYGGMIHGFFGMGDAIDQARVAHQEACEQLRAAFARF